MEEKREEDFEEEFDEDGYDPTKEAFFSDMMNMEEEIASEAYELVEHAINLIGGQYYDDGIEILRQAIGLYTQINREEEIKAINDKISEVYVLKEKSFREIQAEPEREVEVFEEAEIIEEPEAIKEIEEVEMSEQAELIEEPKIEADLISRADQLIVEAYQLTNSGKFEEALDKYDTAEKILEDLNKTEEIERLFSLIEECYNKKAEYLRSFKKEELEVGVEIEAELSEEQAKEKKLEQFLETKKREEEISTRAYEILDQAVERAKLLEYDQAIKLYTEGVSLFEKLKWTYEAKRIRDTIEQLQKEKLRHLKELERERVEMEQKIETELEKEKLIDQYAKEVIEQEKIAQVERLKGIEFQKMEQEFFKAQIDNMVSEAAMMAREYELEMQRAIKDGKIVEECIYPKVIEIYKNVKELLVDKGWNKEAAIYDDTIDVYIQKFEKDKKIRHIEADKVKKQKETEELLKVQEQGIETPISEEQQHAIKEQRQKAIEIQNIRNQIEEMTKRAERLTREYEVALRKGKFELKCPYSEIINIFEKAREMALERGWDTDVTIFSSQIYSYKQKLEKDNRLRQIEVDKARKQEEIEETLKVKKKEPFGEIDTEKLKLLEKQKKAEEEKEEFDSTIDVMVNRAEKMAREYNSEMKKAIKKGKLAENPPFLKIIGIYEKIKRMLLEKGREEEAAAYSTQIIFYSQKLEHDNKLREVEAKKAHRERALEEMHKIGKQIGVDEQRLKIIERKKEEESFEKFVSDKVNNAEKMVRDYEMDMRKAYRKGEIIKNTPYSVVIEIYKDVREKVYARGWKDQAEVYTNQIKIYQEKLEKHQKLLEVETQKVQREKDIEEMHKVEKEVEIDHKKRGALDRKKEEKEFQKYITEGVNKAAKLEREFDSVMKKAIKKGEILEQTPFLEIIEIYKEMREKVYARGWKDQAEVYANQIKIYQEKLEKYQKLLEVEAQKIQRVKDIEEMHKVEKEIEIDHKKLDIIEEQKEEEVFEKFISDKVNYAEKIVRDYEMDMRKAYRQGKVLESTPYSKVIEIYKEIREKVYARGWKDQAEVYANQIKMYQEKLEKHQKLLEVEAQKIQREKDIEEMQKAGKKEVKPFKPEKIMELEAEKEEDMLVDKAMNLIGEIEKEVKSYELSIKKDILVYSSPYEKAISNYEEARELFQKVGWNDEANRLINTIKFYKDKKEKDDKLRIIEQKKLETPEIKLAATDLDMDKDFLERQKRLLEIQQKEKESDESAAAIFNMIQNAERMAQEYEIKIKGGVFDFEAPYEKIIEIYRNARKRFEEIGWKEESAKLIETIKFYKEKLAKDNNIRALEAEKVKKREEELMIQQKLLEQARVEQKKLLQQRKETLHLKKERVAQFETQKDKAFRLMDQAKRELRQNHFENAIEIYKESEKMFSDMEWQEGITMVRDSITMIVNKKKAFELEKEAIEKRKAEELLIEEKLEEKLAEAGIIKKQQQKEKRKEFLKIQREKEQERQISEEAYKLLEEGTALMDHGKFTEAYDKYIAARELFEKVSWQREVSRINNELLFKLKREQKQAEIYEEIKIKKIEEEKEMVLLKEEAKREHKELEKRKKEEKRKLAKEELDIKISIKLDKADRLIDSYRYNEGIMILRKEVQRLTKLEKYDEIERITKQINKIKTETQIPLITADISIDDLENINFESAYKALDEVHVSLANGQIKKAISELNEAKYQLKELKIGKNFIKEIDKNINELKASVSKTPIKELVKGKEEPTEDEMEKLRKRIKARREERRKKVLDLLGKSEE